MRLIFTISRLKRLCLSFLCIFFVITDVSGQDSSDSSTTPAPKRRAPPHIAATGKLNQFSGFYTPRPLPSNANFVYASIWASWSAWSFCANNVQIRVRACNTVRGFTCPGPNQERKPCGQALANQGLRQRFRRPNGLGGDYDAVDPWEEDRREALKQLYADYTPPEGQPRDQSQPRGLGKSLKPEGDFIAVQRSPGKTLQAQVGGYGHVPVAPLRPPPESDFHRKLHSDGPGQAPSMTPELLFGSKLEVPPKRIKSASSESKEQKLEGISAEAKESKFDASKSASHELTPPPSTTPETIIETETPPGRPVPSRDTNENPLKMGIPKDNHDQVEEISKPEATPQGQDEAPQEEFVEDFVTKAIPTETEATTPILEHPPEDPPELDTGDIQTDPLGSSDAIEVTPEPPSPEPPLVKDVLKPKSPAPTAEVFEPPEDSDLMTPHHLSSHEGKISPSLPKDEMYDDQFESAAEKAKVGSTPEDKIKQLEADMDALESQISSKLHSGEVSFNKDTEKALEWMLANMTKAAEEVAAHQAQLEKAKIKHTHEGPLHSGEVQFPKEEHDGEFSGTFGKPQELDKRLFAAKVSPLDSPITLRKIIPDIQKPHPYDALRYEHAKVIKPIELKVTPSPSTKNPEAELLEHDLIKLREEMAAMQSELVALQGTPETSLPRTSIVEVHDDKITTIPTGPNMKALDLELVPKAPKPIGGPHVPVVSATGTEGEVFLLDIPQEKGEAQWSPWRPWGDCFCDKQVRTRICNYDSGSHSKGCQGKSYESRPCVTTRPCPAKLAAAKRLKATTPNPFQVTDSEGLYTLAPHKGPRTGYAFKPNPLSLAISSRHK